MPFLRTILGDVPSAAAGVCYAHEHLIIDPSFTTFRYPEFLLDSVDCAVRDVAAFRAAGGGTLVDSMPIGGGRNAAKLAELSRRTGAHILCPTGLHLAKYYAPGHWSERLSAERLADLFVAEIEEGIDLADGNGPSIARGVHRAGLIKIATGEKGIDARAERIFEAAVATHRATGAPILTHTEQGAGGMAQLELLVSLGANLAHVVLSHTDRRPDPAYHAALLATGVMLEYDSAFRWPEAGPNPTADLIVAMVEAGYAAQLLLGMDMARRSYWSSYGGGPGLTFLLEAFAPRLRARGLARADIDAIFVDNPARAFAFVED